MVAVLRHTVQSRVLAVEDIQPVVLGRRKAQPVQLLVDTVTLVAGTVEVVDTVEVVLMLVADTVDVLGTVEVDMVLVLQRQRHMARVVHWQLRTGLTAAEVCRAAEVISRAAVGPYF